MGGGDGRRGCGLPRRPSLAELGPVDVVGAQLLNQARARQASRLVDEVFDRIRRDEIVPLHKRLVELGYTPTDAAVILGTTLRMVGAGLEEFTDG